MCAAIRSSKTTVMIEARFASTATIAPETERVNTFLLASRTAVDQWDGAASLDAAGLGLVIPVGPPIGEAQLMLVSF
jgi:hypothetical protein